MVKKLSRAFLKMGLYLLSNARLLVNLSFLLTSHNEQFRVSIVIKNWEPYFYVKTLYMVNHNSTYIIITRRFEIAIDVKR